MENCRNLFVIPNLLNTQFNQSNYSKNIFAQTNLPGRSCNLLTYTKNIRIKSLAFDINITRKASILIITDHSLLNLGPDLFNNKFNLYTLEKQYQQKMNFRNFFFNLADIDIHNDPKFAPPTKNKTYLDICFVAVHNQKSSIILPNRKVIQYLVIQY